MEDVTFIILTKNEEKNLPQCLKSIKGFAKRVIVVDSGSSDKTCDIARKMGADVYVHEFENYARQFNWGIDNTNITTTIPGGSSNTAKVTRNTDAAIIAIAQNGFPVAGSMGRFGLTGSMGGSGKGAFFFIIASTSFEKYTSG